MPGTGFHCWHQHQIILSIYKTNPEEGNVVFSRPPDRICGAPQHKLKEKKKKRKAKEKIKNRGEKVVGLTCSRTTKPQATVLHGMLFLPPIRPWQQCQGGRGMLGSVWGLSAPYTVQDPEALTVTICWHLIKVPPTLPTN